MSYKNMGNKVDKLISHYLHGARYYQKIALEFFELDCEERGVRFAVLAQKNYVHASNMRDVLRLSGATRAMLYHVLNR